MDETFEYDGELFTAGDRVYVAARDDYSHKGRAFTGVFVGRGEGPLVKVKPDGKKNNKQVPPHCMYHEKEDAHG